MTQAITSRFDAIIVGARVAGASLAIHLAKAGKRVALIDRATFPSDTVSTHVIYPNTIERLDSMGVLETVMAHKPPPLYTMWHHEGRAFVAPHTSIAGRDWAICVRRSTLDNILVERARDLGVAVYEATQFERLIGAGTDADPAHGIVARRDAEILTLHGNIVIGADGVNSAVARLVGADRTKVMPSETMLFYAYWTGVKSRNTQDFFFESPWVCAHFPADDGHHVITMNGPVAVKKDIPNLEAFYMERIKSIPALAARLDGATKVSHVKGSVKLEGFYRRHVGPGWALTGDAAHFKHPSTAQGIGDAFHAAEILAQGLIDNNWSTTYPAWREQQSREFYAFSKHLAEPPGDAGMRKIMDALIENPILARRMVDIWSRSASPWAEVIPFIDGMDKITGASVEGVLAPYEDTRVAVRNGRA